MTAPYSQVPGPITPRAARRRTGWWYFVLTILTVGLFAWVPFLHAAQRLRGPKTWRLAAIYGAADILLFALIAVTPTDSVGNPTGTVSAVLQNLAGVAACAITIVACMQLIPIRREVYGLARPVPATPALAFTDPAVAAVFAARARRDEARAIVAKDPLMARELGIGRPDKQRAYNDGGLVDLNSAPASAIAALCSIPLKTAEQLEQVRDARGGSFTDVTEALILAETPVQFWEQIRDRAVVVP
jgi:hypothetical protein